MKDTNTPCYRYFNSQRVDGKLRFRNNVLHFEADFPSRHRVHLPIHQILGYSYKQHPPNEESEYLSILSELGSITFYPLDRSINTILTEINNRWSPNPTLFEPTQAIAVEKPILQAYLEGHCSINDVQREPCAIQIHPRTLGFLRRNQSIFTIEITDIVRLSCHSNWVNTGVMLSIETHDTTIIFEGSHTTQLWAHLDCLKEHHLVQSIWTDKRHWWKPSCSIAILKQGVRWYPSTWLWNTQCQIQSLNWDGVHTIDFGNGRLNIIHTDGKTSLGQRHRTSFYKNMVENILDVMCHSFEQGLVGLWDDNRIVHLGTLKYDNGHIRFTPRNQNLSILEYPLEDLWMPELYDASKSFLQIRVPSIDPIPQWIVIHCGHPTIAQNWDSVLNIPSKRIRWAGLPSMEKHNAMHLRDGVLKITSLEDIPVQIQLNSNTIAIHSNADTLPVNEPLEFWFDDGQQRLRICSTILFQQDLPERKWILDAPKHLDIFNHRAHHRTHVQWTVHIIPLTWNTDTGWIPKIATTYTSTMTDISQTGCALELETSLENIEACLLQFELDETTVQLLGTIKYQQYLSPSNHWRVGVEFFIQRKDVVQRIRRLSTTDFDQEELHS
jgi:hypothetical protein